VDVPAGGSLMAGSLGTDELAGAMVDLSSGGAAEEIQQTICAFANDLPNTGRPGVLFVGVDVSGNPSGLAVTDALLLDLAQIRDRGNILPLPSMTVEKMKWKGADVVAMLKHYRSLMPLAHEARKPVFHLKPSDGAIGAHSQAAREIGKDFERLARTILERAGIELPAGG